MWVIKMRVNGVVETCERTDSYAEACELCSDLYERGIDVWVEEGMGCDRAREVMDTLELCDLTQAEVGVVFGHVEGCVSCRQWLAEDERPELYGEALDAAMGVV